MDAQRSLRKICAVSESRRPRAVDGRQIPAEGGAPANFHLDFDETVVIGDDAATREKTAPSAYADTLGAKEPRQAAAPCGRLLTCTFIKMAQTSSRGTAFCPITTVAPITHVRLDFDRVFPPAALAAVSRHALDCQRP